MLSSKRVFAGCIVTPLLFGAAGGYAAADASVTNDVKGAKCFVIDSNEGSFGYPIELQVPVDYGDTLHLQTRLFDAALLNWTAYKDGKCTDLLGKTGLLFVPWTPGVVKPWTAVLK